MRVNKMLFMTLLLAVFIAGCGDDNGGPADTTAPTVSSTNPVDTTIDVPTNRSITAIFNEAMDTASCTTTTFTLHNDTADTGVTGTVTCVGKTAIFRPASNLAVSSVYSATITTGMKDKAGNILAVNKLWSFTTGTTTDMTAPTVDSTNPADMATDVVINRSPAATFSEAIDPATCTTTTFTLHNDTADTDVIGTVACVGSVATFDPTSNLAADTDYTATITAGVKDLAGNTLAGNYVWSFTTGTGTATAGGPAPVLLGTAGNFVVLSKSGISTTGATDIVGDIGVSPIDQTGITGFSEVLDGTGTFSTSIYVTGMIYAADYAPPTPAYMTTAISDMEIAYTDAAGRTDPDFTELGAGNIGGLVLPPGLYKWGTGVLVPIGGVTLSGGADDVWIFQISGDLTVANAAIVHLSGGAQAKNVFWQTFGVATIGTTAQFEGILLSQTSISLGTGAEVNGKLLAQTAVVLDSNAINVP